ncbi:MAG: pitrilysin family protein [Proteobacteria bacterium]|nr:pitrilysin family protein [Pseudomonadota bacterium]
MTHLTKVFPSKTNIRATLGFLLMANSSLLGAAAAWTADKAVNGMDVVMMQSSKVPLTTVVLVSKAGARTESIESNGLTHLWEHMFFKGNARLPDQEAFNARVRQLGIVFNGDTSAEIVRYYFTLPSANLDSGIQFMSDAISTPLLEESELERERKVVLDEYDRNASQPGFDLNNMERMTIYGSQEHLRNALGRRRIIETATRQQLLQIKNDVFVPTNCALIVSGDFEPKNLMQSINKHFANWTTPKDWKPIERGNFPAFPPSSEITMHHHQAQNALMQITFSGPRASFEPTDTFAADALISLLDHRSGKFFKKYIDSGLTLQSALSYHTQGQAGELVIYGMVPAKDLIKAREMLYKEPVEWLKPDYFTATQLEDVRRRLIITHKFELNKPSDYAKTLAFWWGTTGMDYLSTYRQNVEKVSLTDIQKFVGKYFIAKPRLTTILVNDKEAKAVGIEDNSKPIATKLLNKY